SAGVVHPRTNAGAHPARGLGWQWTPPDMITPLPPGAPGRRPHFAGSPAPSNVHDVAPASVVVSAPPKFFLRVPRPAAFVAMPPAALGIGTPSGRNLRRSPATAIAAHFNPPHVPVTSSAGL